jgi:hypothetical protein
LEKRLLTAGDACLKACVSGIAVDLNARQTSPFRTRKDSADGGAVLGICAKRR